MNKLSGNISIETYALYLLTTTGCIYLDLLLIPLLMFVEKALGLQIQNLLQSPSFVSQLVLFPSAVFLSLVLSKALARKMNFSDISAKDLPIVIGAVAAIFLFITTLPILGIFLQKY